MGVAASKELELLIRQGAGSQDIVGVDSPKGCESINQDFLKRELGRVEAHSNGFCKIIRESFPGKPRRILDLGCSTGGSTVALKKVFPKTFVVGVDPHQLSVNAARLRASIENTDVSLVNIEAGRPLPFYDGAFEIVVVVSVLEFIPRLVDRISFLNEVKRVAADYVFLAIPNYWYLRELHTKRWFGNQRPSLYHPWSNSRGWLLSNFPGWEVIDTSWYIGEKIRALGPFAEIADRITPWTRLLLRRPFV